MERRDFIKMSCGLCMAVGAGALVSALSSCTPSKLYKTTIADNKVAIPLSLFAENNIQLVRPSGYGYDIAIRKDGEIYTALLMRCTHADNPVSSTGKGYECYLHGSRFDENGAVLKGPAAFPLQKLKTSVGSSELIIGLS